MANPFVHPCSRNGLENTGYYQNLNVFQLYQLEILVDKIEIFHGKLKNCGSFDDSETDDDDPAAKNVTFNKSVTPASSVKKKKSKHEKDKKGKKNKGSSGDEMEKTSDKEKEKKSKKNKGSSGDEMEKTSDKEKDKKGKKNKEKNKVSSGDETEKPSDKEKEEKPKKEKKSASAKKEKVKKKKAKKKSSPKKQTEECICFPIDPWGSTDVQIHSKSEFDSKPESGKPESRDKSLPPDSGTDTEKKKKKKKKKVKEEVTTDATTDASDEEGEEKTDADMTDTEVKSEKSNKGKKEKVTKSEETTDNENEGDKGKSTDTLKKSKSKGGTPSEEATEKKKKGKGKASGDEKKDLKKKSKSTISVGSSQSKRSKKKGKRVKEAMSLSLVKPPPIKWKRWRPPLKYPLPPLRVSVTAFHIRKIYVNQVDLDKLYPTLEEIPDSEDEYPATVKKLQIKTSKVSGKSSKSKGGSRPGSVKESKTPSTKISNAGSAKDKKEEKGVDAKKLQAALQSLHYKQEGTAAAQSCGDVLHNLIPDDKEVVETEQKKAERAMRAALREKRGKEQARRDEALYRLARCTHFNRGLSCVFASTPLGVITSMLKSTFTIQIERSDLNGPAYYIGKVSIVLPQIYVDMVQRAAGCDSSTLPLWACTDDIFPVVNERGKEVGTVWAYVCLTCLGRAVSTQHLVTQTGLYAFTNMSKPVQTNPLKCSTMADACAAFTN